eukprot:Em0274g5a
MDLLVCDSGQLVLNRAVMGQIEDLLIYCHNGLVSRDGGKSTEVDPSGCKRRIKLGSRDDHESKCEYSRVSCPVGGDLCGPLRQYQLEEHLLACTCVPCSFASFGCVFRGTCQEVKDHKAMCSFKDDTQLLAITMRELKTVKGENAELSKTVNKALKSIEKLSIEREAMSAQLQQQAVTITTLCSRVDKLEAELSSYSTLRMRQSSRQMKHVESDRTPQYQRKSSATVDMKRLSTDSITSVTSVPSLNHTLSDTPFPWHMPFTMKCVGTFRGHKGTVWSMVIAKSRLYSSSSDGSIKEWDIEDLRRGCLKTVSAHKECAMCLAATKKILFSAGTDHTLRSWDLSTLEEIAVVERVHEGIVSAMVCSKEYVFTSSLGCIKVWDPVTLKEVHNIDGFSQSWVRALFYDKRTNRLFSGSSNRVNVWKGNEDFGPIHTFETSYGAIYSLAVTTKYIIIGTHNQNIQIYDVATLKHMYSLNGHIGIVTVLKVVESPSGSFMFSGSSDASVQVWNLENLLPIQALQRHEKAVHSMAVWQDTVFTGSEDMEIKVFKHFKL